MATQKNTIPQPHPITRVALYARVSTVNHGQDTQVQTRELQEYASRRGWTVVGEYHPARRRARVHLLRQGNKLDTQRVERCSPCWAPSPNLSGA